MKLSAQGLWPALPGAILIGVLFGAIAALAVSAGAAYAQVLARVSVLGASLVAGGVGFCIGAAVMLLFHYRNGTTLGISQALKDLWEALGKWQF